MKVQIRQATITDSKGIHQLFVESIKEFNAEDAARYDNEVERNLVKGAIEKILKDVNKILYIAELEESIVGLIFVDIKKEKQQIIPPIRSRKYAYIEIIEVKKEYRKNGLGKELMKMAELWAVRKKVSNVELEVFEHNKNVISFYEALGYNHVRRIFSKRIE